MIQSADINPLTITSAKDGAMYVMRPVPDRALGTVLMGHKVIALHSDDAHRARKYMERYDTRTVALEDGTAFTLFDDDLVDVRFIRSAGTSGPVATSAPRAAAGTAAAG